MIGPSLAVKAAGIMSCAVKSAFVIVCVRVGIPTPMTRGSKLYPSLLCLSKILVHVSACMTIIQYRSMKYTIFMDRYFPYRPPYIL